MFDYPLPLPQKTHYHLLGIGPEASADEVREALARAIQDLQERKAAIDRVIKDVYEKIPGFREAEERVKELRVLISEGNNQSKSSELTTVMKKLDEYESKALKTNANFKHLQNQSEELAKQTLELNSLNLANVDKRREYDKTRPPLDLLKLTDCTCDNFANMTDHRLALALLRQEISYFLKCQGEEVFCPSDINREDFSSDFVFNPLLDVIDG